MGMKGLRGERILFTWRVGTGNKRFVILLEIELEEGLEGRPRVIREYLPGGEAPAIGFRHCYFETESALTRVTAIVKSCAIVDCCTLAGSGHNWWTLGL